MKITRRNLMAGAAIAASVAVLTACAPSSSNTTTSAGDKTTLSLVAYSVPKAADGAIEKAFAKTNPGKGVTWKQSYGASGDQSRAVVGGLKADVVHFSLAPDVTRLVDEGLVDKAWDQNDNKGILSTSVVAIVVRKGNPKHIESFADLAKPGVGVVTPNPGSSGSARWNILAAYQSIIANGGSEADAKAYLKKLFANVKALPGSGRDATTAFQGGTGDVLLSYENEAIFARQSGESRRLRRPEAEPADREPGRRHDQGGAGGQEVPRLRDQLRGPGHLREVRLPSGRVRPGRRRRHRQGRQRPGRPVPEDRRAVHDRQDLRWLVGRQHQVLRREERHHHQDHRGVRQVVTTEIQLAPGAARKRRTRSATSLTRSSGLGLGVALTWFSLLVLIPLALVVIQSADGGWQTFRDTLTNSQTAAALRLTVTQALIVTVVNVVFGTLIAWVLVRDDFRGKRLLEVIIDIPFALPTIVAGLVLLSLYGPDSPIGINVANTERSVFLALLFVTLPFVVRTVEPVLLELDPEVEEAAASLGASRFTTLRRILLPALAPAITAGAALSFARGISEYGSLVLLSGNLPNKTEVASVRILTYIENGNEAAAASVAVLLLAVALVAIILLQILTNAVAKRG